MQAFKVAVLVQRFRRPPTKSSPSLRQIALVIVTGGLVIMLIRVATRKAKSHGESADIPPVSQDGAQDATPDEAQAAPQNDNPSGPATARNDTVAGDRTLTDRVQREMFRRADAPAQAGGSD